MRTIRTITRYLSVLLAALAVFAFVAAAQVPEKPAVPRAVNDFAGIFSASDAEYMNRVLVSFADSTSNRIVENEMIPRFKENDYAGGVAAALNVLMRLSAGEISYKEYEDSISAGGSIAMIVFGLLFVLIILGALFGKNGPRNIGSGGSHTSSVADAIFWSSILGGGRSHGGGFSGGGFSGGFGGGSFGGGGAGGSW